MSRMIDLIRASAVPSNLMQSAAKGSLSVPSGEMIEILVHLAVNNRVFSEQAQLTLAGWDVYDVIECEAVSIPAVDEPAFTSLGATVGVRILVDSVDLLEAPLLDRQGHVAAKTSVGISALEYFGQRIDWEDGEFFPRQQLQYSGEVRAAVAGEAAPAFHRGFFLAVAVQIAVERRREALQRLPAFAAVGSEVGKIRV